ncbi:hypothetical protein [Nocardioides sp.]|uniref:AraC-like ligand-binding domain-containing protein n=1 Tax=Nocardioides sp. TaxID=35761 RepID=UPI0034222697
MQASAGGVTSTARRSGSRSGTPCDRRDAPPIGAPGSRPRGDGHRSPSQPESACHQDPGHDRRGTELRVRAQSRRGAGVRLRGIPAALAVPALWPGAPRLGTERVRLGMLTAGRLSYGRALRILTDELQNFHVNLPVTGRATSRCGRGDAVTLTPGGAAVFSPGERAEHGYVPIGETSRCGSLFETGTPGAVGNPRCGSVKSARAPWPLGWPTSS